MHQQTVPELPDKPPFTTLSHQITTGLDAYDAKCKQHGINPFADYTRFMQIVQAVIAVKTNTNVRIS